jgi:hypothetical protein
LKNIGASESDFKNKMERLFNQAIVNVEKEIDLIPLVSVNKKTQ